MLRDGKPEATTSIALSSWRETPMFRSQSFVLQRTVAPASRQTQENVLSVGVALIRRRPERGHAARCLPRESNLVPQTHATSEICRGSRNLSRTNVRKTTGCNLNSRPVGPQKHISRPWPWMGTNVGLVCSTRLSKTKVSR